MANSAQAKKRARQAEQRRQHNVSIRQHALPLNANGFGHVDACQSPPPKSFGT